MSLFLDAREVFESEVTQAISRIKQDFPAEGDLAIVRDYLLLQELSALQGIDCALETKIIPILHRTNELLDLL
jgi:hypothetical protein